MEKLDVDNVVNSFFQIGAFAYEGGRESHVGFVSRIFAKREYGECHEERCHPNLWNFVR